jgi:hypothetical protein
VVGGYAAVFAAVAFALTRPVLLVNDGQMYFEMARSMRHGTLEFWNGLDVVDSPELWMQNSVKQGPHLFAKYPPLYGVIAAAPYAWFGVRGLYLLNATGFVFAVLGFHELARRVIGPRRALVTTLLLPFGVPLVPYMLMEMPHLVALAPVLWAIALWDDALRSEGPRRAGCVATAAGLLAGLAFGIRIQDVVLALPLCVVAFFHSRHRAAVLTGLLGGLGACVGAVAAFNLARFGSPNPFSYGPHEGALGAPVVEERLSFFLRPARVTVIALVVGGLLAGRRWGGKAPAALVLLFGAIVVVAVAPVRTIALGMAATLASTTLNAGIAGPGWYAPDTTLGWIDKALLSSTPFAALGLAGAVASAARPAPPIRTVLGWMVISLLLFLSVRDPDPRTERGVVGFMSLSPRYLVEIMPLLYLLAWERLRSVRFGAAHLVTGLLAGALLFAYMRSTGPGDGAPPKRVLILTAPIVAAALLVLVDRVAAGPARTAALATLVALTHGYAAACIFAEDATCLRGMAATYERWGQRVLAAMPEPEVALVGWRYAKDAVFHVRASKLVVIVDPSVDDGATLPSTLDALVARGMTPYYFGLGLERVLPRLAGRYRAVLVLGDPLLWRLEGAGATTSPSLPRGRPL